MSRSLRLKRQAIKLLAELELSKEPILNHPPREPSAYLVDVESYEPLLRHMNLLEGIARGEKAIGDGRTLNHAQARDCMR